jgi:hypothetical protein
MANISGPSTDIPDDGVDLQPSVDVALRVEASNKVGTSDPIPSASTSVVSGKDATKEEMQQLLKTFKAQLELQQKQLTILEKLVGKQGVSQEPAPSVTNCGH